jgi:hypothetical protein
MPQFVAKKIAYPEQKPPFANFWEFYPFYLGMVCVLNLSIACRVGIEFIDCQPGEHMEPTNRKLHFIGTSCVIVLQLLALLVSTSFFWYTPVAGYGCAWVGHYFFEVL